MGILTIDINAHIANISCDIVANENNLTASVSFDNICNKVITAVKFNAIGYNSFGDVILANGKEKFWVTIQDIKIEANSHIEGLKVKIPYEEIRKLELEEYQICYADGTISTYEKRDIREFEISRLNENLNDEMLLAIKDRYGDQLKIQPIESDCGWICSCERLNSITDKFCSSCGNKKSDMFGLNDQNIVRNILSEYKEKEKVNSILKEKKNKKRRIIICVGIVIGIISVIIVGHSIIMSGRTTFTSENEMKEALQGTYTYYEGYDAEQQIEIKEDQFRYIYKNLDSNHWMDIDWYPEKGVLHTFEDIVVTKNGDLKVNGKLYEQGGYVSTDSTYSNSTDSTYSNSYESGHSVLDITVNNVSHNSIYTVCTGSIKNTGNKTYKFIELKGSFEDSEGNVIDTDWTYAAGSEGLGPNESTTFRLSVTKNYDIKSCSVTLLDFD